MDEIVAALKSQSRESKHLDQACHDAASEQATAANNEGLEAQVAFLLARGWGPADIEFHAGEGASEE